MTSNDEYKPSAAAFAKIAEISKSERDFRIIIEYIYKRFNDDGKHWKRIFKALMLLEHLLKKVFYHHVPT